MTGITNVQFNLAALVSDHALATRAGAGGAVGLSGMEKTSSRWPALRCGSGAGAGWKSRRRLWRGKAGGPERQACTSPRPRTGCRPNVDEILGLIAAARNAGPMPSESHEQVSDLS
jgi:hypothetical protein